MHMADALINPPVGGLMWAASAAAIGISVKNISGGKLDEKKIQMMGIMGAFVFAGQMINFTIPGTGSSGHICGGILLAALLGPASALIVLASVLLIQCLFFADGGLLAFGCNVFNMGVTSAVLGYLLVYKPIVGKTLTKARISIASVAACIVGLQIGAFLVVLETLISGVTELPLSAFLLAMQPIHLAIGLVEGLITAAVLSFVQQARPEILETSIAGEKIAPSIPIKKVLITFAVFAVVIAGGLSIFASAYPDGLEWSLEKTLGTAELEQEGPAWQAAADVVEKTAVLPDYAFKNGRGRAAGTVTSGIVGSVITVILACGIGFGIHALRRRHDG